MKIVIGHQSAELGALCRIYREQVLHLSQCQFSELTGACQPNISDLEKGKRYQPNMVARYFDAGLGNWLDTLHGERADCVAEMCRGERGYMLDIEHSLKTMRKYCKEVFTDVAEE